MAPLLTVGLLLAGCGDDSAPGSEVAVETTAPTTVTLPDPDVAEAERAARIEQWADRPFDRILAEGFDTTACGADASTGGTVRNDGWAFLPLPLEVEDVAGPDGTERPTVALEGGEVHPHARSAAVPTRAWIRPDDQPMLDRLTDPATADSGAVVVLAIAPVAAGSDGDPAPAPADTSFAWLLTDETVIPFSGECDRIAAFRIEAGDPVTELPRLRTDPFRRARLAGLEDDPVDFADCANEEISISSRPGFGGTELGLAFGPWPADAGTFTDIGLEGWTIVPPAGDEAPTFAVRGAEGFPSGNALDPDGWLMTFTTENDRAVVHTIFHADDELGLHIWPPTIRPGVAADPCYEARQVIAFREFLDDRVPTDRPAWDLTPALPGDEALVIDTIRMVIGDPTVRARFTEWTPCTSKLCESNDEVVR